jgi:two-component system, NarL family, sensor histidine kinase UhpB
LQHSKTKQHSESDSTGKAEKSFQEFYRLRDQQVSSKIIGNQDYYLFTTDSTGQILSASLFFYNLIGKKKKEVIGKSILEFLHDQDSDIFAAHLKRLSRPPYSGYCEVRIISLNGWKWIFFFNEAFPDNNGNISLIKYIGRDVTSRKAIEKSFLENEDQFRQIFDNVNNAIAIYEALKKGADFIIKDFNKAAEKATHASRKEISGQLVSEVFPDIKHLGLLRVFQRVWKTGIPEYFPASLYKDDRITLWTENYVFKLKSGEIAAIFEDITERKQMEADLKYQAELLESLPDAVISMNKSTIIKSWSKGAEATYGWRQDEVLGKKYTDVIKIKFCDVSNFKKIVNQAIEDGIWSGEIIQNTKNGDQLFVRSYITPIRDPARNIIGVVALNRNITEQIRIQRAFMESEERYRAFFENSIDANIITSPDGTIFTANEEACQIFQMSEHELCQVGRNGVLDKNDPRLSDALRERARTGRFKGELNFKRKDGTIFPGEISSSIFHDSNGKTKTSMIIRDITDRKRAEEALKDSQEQLRNFSAYLQSELEAEKKHLAAEVHDELGQMLTALKIDLSWLSKKLPAEFPELSQKTRSMMSLVDDTNKVVRRITSKLRPPVLDDLGLLEALKWLRVQFQERTGIKCSLKIPETDNFGKRQSTELFRIIQEALTNVSRHSGATRVSINIRKQTKYLKVVIKDNGTGITKSEINNQASYGLMGMDERVKTLGGILTIEGKKDEGTTVKFRVPLEECE